ncbi:MAG: hypothetical protein GQF41_0628 [Candidatus Rifleibacterium amylolyticum]|nr:MAG: hypothetical protein GQF41_0628 [Candidatus Rifleibacterium amylolyticum]
MKTVKKMLLAIVGLVAIVFVVQTARIVSLFRSASSGMSGVTGSAPASPAAPAPSRLPLPDLVLGLTRPAEWHDISSSKISSPFSLTGGKLVPLDEAISDMEEIKPEIRQRFEKELPARLMSRIKDLPEPPEIPEILIISAPTPDFRAIRETARYWYLMSRWFFSQGQHEIALAIDTAILLLAHEVETCDAAGASLISRMIAIAVRNIGTAAIMEMSDKLNLPAARLKSWTAVLMRLHDNMPGMERAWMCEKKLIPSVFHASNIPNRNRLAEAMCDPNRQKKYIDTFYNPLIEACKKPYPEAMEVARTHQKKAEELQRILDPGLHYLVYFFMPEDFFMQFMMSMAIPSFRKAFDQDFNSRQVFRAAIIVLALRAYQIEHKSLPDSLEELEKWLGKSLPADVYTDKPMLYNNSGEKILYSAGPDGKPDTSDDTVFMPITP